MTPHPQQEYIITEEELNTLHEFIQHCPSYVDDIVEAIRSRPHTPAAPVPDPEWWKKTGIIPDARTLQHFPWVSGYAAANEMNALCGWFMQDALTKIWIVDHLSPKTYWLNPPYSAGNIDRFMQKALEESQKGAVVVCLVPCATDTKWWHSYAMKAQEIRFIKGRVRFIGYDEEGKQIKNSPTFSSCVVIFRQHRRQDWEGPIIGETIVQPRSVKA